MKGYTRMRAYGVERRYHGSGFCDCCCLKLYKSKYFPNMRSGDRRLLKRYMKKQERQRWRKLLKRWRKLLHAS